MSRGIIMNKYLKYLVKNVVLGISVGLIDAISTVPEFGFHFKIERMLFFILGISISLTLNNIIRDKQVFKNLRYSNLAYSFVIAAMMTIALIIFRGYSHYVWIPLVSLTVFFSIIRVD